jgi:hypothetical protein
LPAAPPLPADQLPTAPPATGLAPADPPPAAAQLPVPPTSEIATLEPLPVVAVDAHPVSPTTGQPRRPVVLGLAQVLFGLTILGLAVAYARSWWDAASVTRLHQSARLFAWVEPDPVSAAAIALVLATALVVVLLVAVWGAVAHNAWRGRLWTRWGGLVALGLSGAAYLINDWAALALIPAGIGCLLLWLPSVARFCRAMAPPPAAPWRLPLDPRPVRYGPQALL